MLTACVCASLTGECTPAPGAGEHGALAGDKILSRYNLEAAVFRVYVVEAYDDLRFLEEQEVYLLVIL